MSPAFFWNFLFIVVFNERSIYSSIRSTVNEYETIERYTTALYYPNIK